VILFTNKVIDLLQFLFISYKNSNSRVLIIEKELFLILTALLILQLIIKRKN